MNRSRLKIIAALVALVFLAGGIWLLLNNAGEVERDPKKEFTELRVVQFYLHLPKDDIIIGRAEEESFATLLDLIRQTVLNIGTPKSGVETFSQKEIDDITEQDVSVSAWLMESQKISTSMKDDSPDRDIYGNAVITTDRVLVALGGKYMGAVFIRDPQAGLWQSWEADRDSIRKFAETLRSGGL